MRQTDDPPVRQVAVCIETDQITHGDWLVVENGTVRRVRPSDFSDPSLVIPNAKWIVQEA